MLKRIEKSQVRMGMYIESMEGDWQETPFPERRFLLSRESDVDLIKTSRISGLFINTAKGRDVDGTSQQPVVTPGSAATRNPEIRRKTARMLRDSTERLDNVFRTVREGGVLHMATVTSIVGEISEQIGDNPAILIDMTRLKSKDKVTFLHSIAVSALLIHFGQSLRLDEQTVHLLGIAGLVHDIGKIAIPSAILNKPGALTPDERDIVMSHPAIGHDMLVSQGGMDDIVLDICRHHHERIDGKGYPDRRAAGDLSLFVRMSAICDVYEAVTSIRPYKKPWSSSYALNWMLEHDAHFDRPLLWKFILSLDAALTRDVA